MALDFYGLIMSCSAFHVTDEFKAFVTPDNINVIYQNGGVYTPLKMACVYSLTAVVKWLLENGADPNISCRTGFMPLHFVFCHGRCREGDEIEKCTRLLIAAGARVNAKTSDGYTPLDMYVSHLNTHCSSAFLLIHAGGRTVKRLSPPWIIAATAAREQCRRVALFFASLSLRRLLPKDIAVLLGKFIWASRGEWMEEALAEHAQNDAK